MQLSIVVPCYNEAAVLPQTAAALREQLAQLRQANKAAANSRIWFVDDGSQDNTWDIIESLSLTHDDVCGIRLSNNRGHQNALLAGLFTADGDALISIDADLQDDVSAIARMVDEFHKGNDIVYGVRQDRQLDTGFKRRSAQLFYRFMRVLGAEIVGNHADYRLMSRRAIEALKDYREVNLFLRGIVPLIGFRSSCVYYKRGIRAAGESKYPLRRMIAFALDGITSFSIVPLRIITFVGFALFLVTLGLSLWVVAVKLFGDNAVPGWASTVLPVYFIGGVQILCLGVMGEYLGKLYREVKQRPRYLVEQVLMPTEKARRKPATARKKTSTHSEQA